ncbi:MAG: zinc-ribbon domain-containing protein [Pirellulaceae bacterium]|nr:zinc-ribbon domain-containing protein [Pirellulaceae bacterium]
MHRDWNGDCILTHHTINISDTHSFSAFPPIEPNPLNSPLNHVPCPNCGKKVDDRAPACPQCGEKIFVNVPGDITPTKHPPLDENRRDDTTG